MNIGNCPRCGKLYALNLKEMCGNCLKDIEREYECCAEFLREQKGATINELSEATQVSIRQITRFIKEGRISIVDAPNLSYPCEVCGALIRESNMCDSCRARLTKELRQAVSDDKSGSDNYRRGNGAYSAIDKLR